MDTIKGKRAVAYFDVLGFKAKIKSQDLQTIVDQYENLINFTNGQITFNEESKSYSFKEVCYRYIFSDSIFLVAYEDTEESFYALLSYAWRMMQFAIACGYPLRGAIVYGDIYVNVSKNIYVGEAIVDAVLLEGSQNWIGAVIDNSVFLRYKNIFTDEKLGDVHSLILQEYNVPGKNGTFNKHFTINWRANLNSHNGIKVLFDNESKDECVQAKIENTLEYCKYLRSINKVYMDRESAPMQYRHVFMGSKSELENPHPIDDGY